MTTASLSIPFLHIHTMTDHIGMWEHCVFSIPDRIEGYATDDNARALQVVLRLPTIPTLPGARRTREEFVSIYLQFLFSARTPKGFHQDLNHDLTWKDDAATTEGFGRAMSALAEASITAPLDDQKVAAAFVFDQNIPLIPQVKSLRAMGQMLGALSWRLQFEQKSPQLVAPLKMRKQLKGDTAVEVPLDLHAEVQRLADELVKAFEAAADPTWQWFEDFLSYDNARLPMGLLFAHQITGNAKYLEIAQQSLDFLLAQTFDTAKDCFSFPGYRGWFPKGGAKALWGQQPIEAGSTTEVCAQMYSITKQEKYLEFAKKSLAWFSGKNISGINMLNPQSGGVKDGLEEWGINPNEGAESILGYALACSAVQAVEQTNP